MSTVNNGYFRRKTLTVDKQFEGASLPGYPKQYHITDAFDLYDALSDVEFRQLSDEDYLNRLTNFYEYVKDAENGIDAEAYNYASGEEPNGYDPETCPIGG